VPKLEGSVEEKMKSLPAKTFTDDVLDMDYIIEWNGLFMYYCNVEQ